MKSQSNSQELEEILEDLPSVCIYCEHPVCLDKKKAAKRNLLALALSCSLERAVGCEQHPKGSSSCTWYSCTEAFGQNAAIDTIEQNINLKFGGK